MKEGRWSVVKPISSGASGHVLLVSVAGYTPVPVHVAVKIVSFSPLLVGGLNQGFTDTVRETFDDFIREAMMLHLLSGQTVSNSVHMYSAVMLDLLPAALQEYVPALPRGSRWGVIAMKHAPGVPFLDYLAARATTCIPLLVKEEALPMIRALLDFSHEAYARHGVTHEDLKLGNIVIDRRKHSDRPFLHVVDMAFASSFPPLKAFGVSFEPTVPEPIWHHGTYAYMAPERIFYDDKPEWAHKAGTDLWALGVIFITMLLTGRRVIKKKSVTDTYRLTNDNRVFNPGVTETMYHLLSADTPWFAAIVNEVSAEIGVSNPIVMQASRVLLWNRAFRTIVFPFVTKSAAVINESFADQFGFLEADSDTYRRFMMHVGRIVNAYNANANYIYEHACRTLVKHVLPKDLYIGGALTVLQAPDVRDRVFTATSPFSHLYPVLFNYLGHKDRPQLTRAPPTFEFSTDIDQMFAKAAKKVAAEEKY